MSQVTRPSSFFSSSGSPSCWYLVDSSLYCLMGCRPPDPCRRSRQLVLLLLLWLLLRQCYSDSDSGFGHVAHQSVISVLTLQPSFNINQFGHVTHQSRTVVLTLQLSININQRQLATPMRPRCRLHRLFALSPAPYADSPGGPAHCTLAISSEAASRPVCIIGVWRGIC